MNGGFFFSGGKGICGKHFFAIDDPSFRSRFTVVIIPELEEDIDNNLDKRSHTAQLLSLWILVVALPGITGRF